MKKETMARFIVILLGFLAAAIPLSGKWLSSRNQPQAIELHARMSENGGWSMDSLEAQVGQPLLLHMTSDDVVHGFAIGKSDQAAVDILPGEFVDITLAFPQPGKYTFYCTRWCGINHWRMRGTIEVSGEGEPLPRDPQPLFLQLGIDIDMPMDAEITPSMRASAERGAEISGLLPAFARDRATYLASSPEKLWLRLRSDSALSSLNDNDLWDAVAWIWQQQTMSDALADGQKLYTTNCAACHGETGKGDGVMARGLPEWNPGSHNAGDMDPQSTGEGLVRPPDFTDAKHLLGVSPALLEGKIIRGGMGTGMPYWGPIFTSQQIEALVSYLYSFAWGSTTSK